jgi:glycosyltransferase involved in cell wall biosynthesis
MRIGIDAKVMSLQAGGIGRSALNLVRSCIREAEKRYPAMEFVLFSGPQTCLDGLQGANWRVDHRFRTINSSFIRLLFCMPIALREQRIDLFHGLDHLGIPLTRKVGTHIAAIHDVIPLLWPRFFTLRHRLVVALASRRVRRLADLVISPSEATKADIVRRVQIAAERIRVIPWGCEARFHPGGDPERLALVRRKYALPARYVLCVSTLEPRKNLRRLLHAYALLKRTWQDDELKLVIAGRKGWFYEDIFATVTTLNLHQDVVFPGFVNDEDLPDLYRGAQLFVFPSLYEGFGLPILEAMASGVPVVTSNTSSMPEVAADAAILVDPHHPQALAEGLRRLLSEAELRQDLQRRGLVQASRFSWETVAQRTLAVYATYTPRS